MDKEIHDNSSGEDGSGRSDEHETSTLRETVVGEELVRFEEPIEDELVPWTGPDGEIPPPVADDGAFLESDLSEAPSPEAVRSAILEDVLAYFEDAEEESFAPLPTEEFVEEQWFSFDYLEGYEELERAWVNEPYAYVSLLYDDDTKEVQYHVSEPVLDDFEEYVRRDLTRILRDSLLYRDVDDTQDRSELFRSEAKAIIADHARTVDGGSLHKLLYFLTRDFVHYGKIDPVMRDPSIEDVSCDGVGVSVFVYHKTYRDLSSNVTFEVEQLDSFTIRLAQKAGKSISISNPLVDASLPDGSRVQLTLGGEISTRGSNFTIRKFADVPYTPIDLIEWNTFSIDEMAYFWLAIENNRSLIFAGGTGSGKTTSLNAVSFFVPPNSKVVSIEDTREITLPHDNWIQSVTRTAITEGGRGEVDMYDLLQSALRQRPEYLLVGEIRTEARVALTFFQAIGTGHTAYTTVHADSIEGVMSRLQNAPLSIPAQMIKNLDVVSIQRQIRTDESRVRRNQAIVEIVPGGDGSEVHTRTVFERDPETDVHERVADSNVLEEIRDDRGWDQQRLEEELSVRREVLAYLLDNGIKSYEDVTSLVHTFHKDPDYVLEKVRSGELALDDDNGRIRSDLAAEVESSVSDDGGSSGTTPKIHSNDVEGTETGGEDEEAETVDDADDTEAE